MQMDTGQPASLYIPKNTVYCISILTTPRKTNILKKIKENKIKIVLFCHFNDGLQNRKSSKGTFVQFQKILF